MKYTEAWAKMAQKNVNLKVALCIVMTCTVVFCFSTVSLSLKKPLIIERGCHSIPIQSANEEKSPEEVKGFINVALRQRFNSTTMAHKDYLSKEARRNKKQEQSSFSKKDIRQSVLVNEIQITEKAILVNADRILSVGAIRSAMPFPLIVQMESQTRSRDNPYGLILTKVKPVKKNKKGGKKGGR